MPKENVIQGEGATVKILSNNPVSVETGLVHRRPAKRMHLKKVIIGKSGTIKRFGVGRVCRKYGCKHRLSVYNLEEYCNIHHGELMK